MKPFSSFCETTCTSLIVMPLCSFWILSVYSASLLQNSTLCPPQSCPFSSLRGRISQCRTWGGGGGWRRRSCLRGLKITQHPIPIIARQSTNTTGSNSICRASLLLLPDVTGGRQVFPPHICTFYPPTIVPMRPVNNNDQAGWQQRSIDNNNILLILV
jgi:hypothetical protein